MSTYGSGNYGAGPYGTDATVYVTPPAVCIRLRTGAPAANSGAVASTGQYFGAVAFGQYAARGPSLTVSVTATAVCIRQRTGTPAAALLAAATAPRLLIRERIGAPQAAAAVAVTSTRLLTRQRTGTSSAAVNSATPVPASAAAPTIRIALRTGTPSTTIGGGGGVIGNPGTPTSPGIVCEISFLDPSSTPVWTDVSNYLKSFTISRGRSFELDRIEAGTATIVLDNRDHRFDPSNTASPYYPNVLVMRRIRIRANFNSRSYTLFTGYVERWPQNWQVYDDAWTEVQASDGFKVFSLFKMEGVSFAQELTGTRIQHVLDQVGWPASDRRLDPGQSTVAAQTVTDYALSHMQACGIDSEMGTLFMGVDGSVVFLDRSEASKAPYITVQGSFGDQPGMMLYANITPVFADDTIWNQIRITRQGGVTQQWTDATSQTHYYARVLEKSVLVSDDGQSLSLAQGLVAAYKDQKLRFQSMVVDPTADPTNLYPQVLGREIGDRIRVTKTWPNSAQIQQEAWIQQIQHSWTAEAPFSWQTTWGLSPATGTSWILGDATYGLLGQTTVLGW